MSDDDSPSDRPLLEALQAIQDRGPIGSVRLVDAVVHSDRFVQLIPADTRRLADLGSGGGLPGLVIGWRRPDIAVTLIERRTARADLLRRAVSALGLQHVVVVTADVAAVARSGERFDVVTARSFGSVEATADAVDGLLDKDGIGLISEPPEDRSVVWAEVLHSRPRLADRGVELGIRRLCRRTCST